MTSNESYTSATKNGRQPAALLLALMLAGLVLRSGWLGWQPLWWDEGYSVYFATESLVNMLWLTARDIHPPLYYALLHGWVAALGGPEPLTLRTFSVLVGFISLPTFYWLALAFFPTRRRLALVATLLLLSSPIHVYYSQEVRMYGLAMLLSMAATGCFWLLLQGQLPPNSDPAAARPAPNHAARERAARLWVGYLLFTTLSLYTLYYTAFLFAAHLAWALWSCRKQISACRPLLSALLLAALLYLPWIIYTAAQLQSYISEKVVADNDAAIGLLHYLFQHLLAFTGGHLTAEFSLLVWLRYAGLVALCLLLLNQLRQTYWGAAQSAGAKFALPAGNGEEGTKVAPARALLWFLLAPSAISFLINLFLPFAPEGGERLLLFVLPYFLLLIAFGIEENWHWRLGMAALLLMLIGAAAGIFAFYTLPRYSARDYRPVVGQMLQQGAPSDTLLAIFPWQVGYWRAYTAQPLRTYGAMDEESPLGPQPLLIGQGAIAWGEEVERQIQNALAQGTLWFPEPLSLGSSLPLQIERYLWNQAAGVTPDGSIRGFNVENRWANPTTRLTAWRWLPQPRLRPLDLRFGQLTLRQVGVGPTQVESANRVIGARLLWHVDTSSAGHSYQASLRLVDQNNRVWASRDVVVSPLDELMGGSDSAAAAQSAPNEFEMVVGLLAPVGVPPGEYHFVIGVGEMNQPASPLDSVEVTPLLPEGQEKLFIQLAQVQIEAPSVPVPAFRLPIQHALEPVARRDGVAFLGYAGLEERETVLAGDEFAVTLFVRRLASEEPLPSHELYVSLLDSSGAGVAGWEGWPLSDYSTTEWKDGALVQLPIEFALPATLPSAAYRVIVGLLEPASGAKSAPVELAAVKIRQRSARFEPPQMEHPLHQPVQFGAHVQLVGYDLAHLPEPDRLELRLHWRVLQSLLPAHNIFVHLVDESGQIITQSDGPPRSVLAGGDTGRAPTGSWLPDEYLTTSHQVVLMPEIGSALGLDEATGDISLANQPLGLRVGLYVPEGGQRLPASVNGQPAGDAALLK